MFNQSLQEFEYLLNTFLVSDDLCQWFDQSLFNVKGGVFPSWNQHVDHLFIVFFVQYFAQNLDYFFAY